MHSDGECPVDVPLRIVDEQAFVGRVPAARYRPAVDFGVGLEKLHLVREEQLLEVLVERQAGALEVGPVKRHRQLVVVAQQKDVVLAAKFLYERYVFRCGRPEEMVMAADDGLPGGAGKAMLEALGDILFHADASGFHVEEESPLVAGVEVLVYVFETGDCAVGLDAFVEVKGQQNAAHVEEYCFNHNGGSKVKHLIAFSPE